mgnify:CR=1 FL=1
MQEPPLASTITEANPLISESPGALFFIGFDATNNLSTSDMTHVACNRLSSDPHAMMDGSHHMLKPQLMGTRTRFARGPLNNQILLLVLFNNKGKNNLKYQKQYFERGFFY